jgi:hypothetical protein
MPFTLSHRLRRVAAGALCAAAVALPLQFAGAAMATTTTSTPLKLQNGWTGAAFGTAKPSVRTVSGIVTFKGGIKTKGASPVAFTLPKAFRPATNVWVPVDLCNALKGRLYIQPSGVVTVQAEKSFSAAQCFTSLDGASFAKSSSSFTPLTPKNGWINGAYGAAHVGARTISGIVHLRGAVWTHSGNTNSAILTLPKAFRPATTVYASADLCNAQNGRLIIFHSGLVEVQGESSLGAAQCFTSLDGVSFARSGSSFTSLKFQNGWMNYSAARPAAVHIISGIVTFKGAIWTKGSNGIAFTLPKADRPAGNVLVSVDTCNATRGELYIQHSSLVTVIPEGGNFSNAACFTSLDGVWFAR